MLYHLLFPLADDFAIFNVFRYITFRSGAAVMTALIISFLMGPRIIAWLRSRQRNGQPIRSDGPASHLLTKQGTPTMGGLMILLAITISTLLWADLSNGYVWAVMAVTGGFGLVGFADDYYNHAVSIYYYGDVWTVGGGIRNVFDDEPPLVDGTEVFAVRNVPRAVGYDLNGRTYFLNIAARFQ